MRTTRSSTMRQMGLCGLALGLTAVCGGALAADAGKTLEIKLGETIQRTWDDVKKADYAYAPSKSSRRPPRRRTSGCPMGARGCTLKLAV